MTTISRSALVPYTPAQMYELVDDVASYPQFLPWCRDAKVLARDEDEVRATLDIAYSGLHKSFTTLNRLQHNKMIEIRLVSGPFRRLEGFWRFDGLGEDGSKVSLDLEFEFSGRLLSMTFGPVFGQIANSMLDAFVRRAESVHGK